MVKLDVSVLRYLTREHFRVLTSVEMGMKNHDLVPTQLINSIAQLKHGGTAKALSAVHKHKLVYHERQVYDGYRLTYAGYDYLALHALTKREVLSSLGNQIGMGKESDVYIGGSAAGAEYAVKFHRLGRTSFRTVKKNRDYLKNRKTSSWLFLSRLAALKEFAFMKVLHDHGFPVPRPVDVNRHVVVMELLADHAPLSQIRELNNPGKLFGKLMELLLRLADSGLVHGDFNEFNLLIHNDTQEPVIIDFPQMISTNHPNAAELFQRDVECLRAFFLKKFKFVAAELPVFEKDVTRSISLDIEAEASGFTKEHEKEFQSLLAEQQDAEEDGEEDSEGDSDEDSEEDGDELDVPPEDTEPPGSTPQKQKEKERLSKELLSPPAFQPQPTDQANLPVDSEGSIPEDGSEEVTSETDRRIVAQRVKQQLQKQKQRQKLAARNNYKGREKRKLREEAQSWAAEKSFSGW